MEGGATPRQRRRGCTTWGSGPISTEQPPRVRGQPQHGVGVGGALGAAVRARGRRQPRLERHGVEEANPAGAGTTSSSRPNGRGRLSNPAGAGRRQPSPPLDLVVGAPPPRVWGRPRWPQPITDTRRATPAGAGTPRRPGGRRPRSSSNPRRCGDDGSVTSSGCSCAEQPPRVRGRPERAGIPRPRQGATPAGAGTTCRTGFRPTAAGSNPRGCGDDPRCRPRRSNPRGCGTTGGGPYRR